MVTPSGQQDPQKGQRLKERMRLGAILGAIFAIFGFPFWDSFLDTFQKAQKTANGPKQDRKWNRKCFQNCTLGRPAEHELDMLFIAFGPHGTPQGRSKTATKNRNWIQNPFQRLFIEF